MEYTLLIPALILQYSLLTLLLLKKPELVNGEGSLGIVAWVPVVGPIAITFGVTVIAMLLAPFLVPLAIANSFVWMLNHIDNVNIDYIK